MARPRFDPQRIAAARRRLWNDTLTPADRRLIDRVLRRARLGAGAEADAAAIDTSNLPPFGPAAPE